MEKAELTRIIEQIIDEWAAPEKLAEVIEEFLKIRTEQGDIINLVPNEAQKRILNLVIPMLVKKKPIRLIILKARQQGISTLIQAIFFILLFTHSNFRALTMGHELDSSNNLFNMYDVYYKELPKYLQPKLEFSNEKKKKYLASQSENKVATAGKGEVGRSDTLQLLHLTEVAFYPDAKKTLGALLQAAKYAMMIVLESTANGIGEEFYNMYWTAKRGESDYIPIFLSWLDFPKYRLDFNNEQQKTEILKDIGKNPLFNEYDNEEILLLQNYNASLEQLHWRRWAIINLCQKDVKTFHQEYPRDDIEAFIATGRPVFNTKICNENLSMTRYLEETHQKPLKVGNLYPRYKQTKEYKHLVSTNKTSYYDLLPHLETVEFIEEPTGYIKIYEKIDTFIGEDYRYAGGTDVSEGLEQGDYSCIKILDRKTKRVALTWHGHIDPDLFGEEHHKIQKFLLDNIYFGIERNNHGLSTIYSAFRLGTNLYYAEDFNKGRTPEHKDLLGFQTNSVSRTNAINTLNEWIREKLFMDDEREFWQETLTFVRNSKGKMQAQNKDSDPGTKCFDDRIIAAMIMARVSTWLPNVKEIAVDNTPKWVKELNKPKQKSFMEL